jgi:hypothetical protein
MQWYFARKDLRRQTNLTDYYWREMASALNALGVLRRKCFITNALGHRVRYAKASQEARAKAEGGV